VPRGEIVDLLWGKDVFVDVDTGVHTAVRKIRQALHDSSEQPRFVETISGKGYRFMAAVEAVSPVRDAARPTRTDLPVATIPAAPPASVVAGPDPVALTQPKANRRRLLAGVLAVAIVAGLLAWTWLARHGVPSRITLGVLPFENLTGDADREYLADGLAEETIASVGQIDPERVSVIGRTSIMAYKRTTKSLAEIGRELGADYLVESSIRAEGHSAANAATKRARWPVGRAVPQGRCHSRDTNALCCQKNKVQRVSVTGCA
jgi:hypothetical protein